MREDQVVAWLGLAFAEVFVSRLEIPTDRAFILLFFCSLSLSLLSLLG